MRKFFIGAMVALGMLFSAGASAQDMAQIAQSLPDAPVDSAVIMGKLPNGLTYYIRHNENPKGQADFFIAQKVGSILENEDQRGLAHFLEHMCFNGTENFPGNSLIDWLETVGVKFGQNLNAYTSIDETVYNISNVPVQRTGVIDSCLLILHDWADGLLLATDEINKERGVIHEEWRRSNAGQQKLMEQLLPIVYPDSKYGTRLPIGLMSVVDNFDPQVLRDYYETWYRPDNQAIIVVGDIDPAYIKSQIEKIFGPIKMPANPAPRVYEGVGDNKGTIYAIGKDKEQPIAIGLMAFKLPQQLLPREVRGKMAYFAISYIESMINRMLNQRTSDMSKEADCPFAQASFELGTFLLADTKDALTLQIVGKGNDIRPAIEAAYRELLRAARHGFTTSEYDRAKTEYIAALDRQYQQRNGRENTSYAREYAQHFTQLIPIPGIEFELEMAKQLEAAMPLQAINQALAELIGPDNRVVMLMLPDTDGYHFPTEAELNQVYEKVDAEEIEPLKDETKAEPLIEKEPVAVASKVSHNAQWDATELTYPNGVKVILKPTKFKEGEIQFQAIAKGGYSGLNADPASLIFIENDFIDLGYGTYTSKDMERYLSGKQTAVSMGISDYTRELAGSTTPKNVKTLFELVYMSFKDPKLFEKDFNGMRERIKSILANQLKNPQVVFRQGVLKNTYKSPAKQFPTLEAIDKANREECEEIIRTMFANPADFNITLVGDFDVDQVKALCDQYIGSIAAPRIASVPFVQNPDMEYTTGADVINDTLKMAEPQVWTCISLSASVPYTAKERMAASMAGQILSNRLIKKIREEMGATYSIGAGCSLARLDKQNLTLQIPFPMNPDRKEEVLKAIAEMVNTMPENVRDDEFQPIQEFMLKTAIENQEKNEAWAGAIASTPLNGVDVFTNQADLVRSITKQDVMAIIKQLIDANNYRVYNLNPAK